MNNYFTNPITITYKDILPGVIAHNSAGIIIGANNNFLSKNLINFDACDNYTYKNTHIANFRTIKTNKSYLSPLYTYLGEKCSKIEDFYAYNLISIPTSDFFFSCTNLEKVYLPTCSSVKAGCFLFGNKKTDFYLLGASAGMLSAGFQYNGSFMGSALALCVNKIYVPSSYFTAWCTNTTLKTFVEVYSGL